MILVRKLGIYLVLSVSMTIILVASSFAAVIPKAFRDEPVAAKVVEWKDMVALDQTLKEQGVVQQPTVIPIQRGPGKKQIPPGALIGPSKELAPAPVAPVPSTSPKALAPSLIQSFLAAPDNLGFIPPDTIGAAGPNHLMVTLNGTVRILNKTGGVVSTVSLNSFWGVPSGTFDPKVYFDEDINRWITVASVSSNNANSAVLVGISSTSDPTQSWFLRSFDADPGNTTWADYPGVGFNQKWIAITMNMALISGGNIIGPKMWVLDKNIAKSPGPVSPMIFPVGFDNAGNGVGFTLIPCHTFGSETDLFILDSGWATGPNDFVRVSKLSGTAGSPSWSQVGFADVQDYADPSLLPGAPQFGSITTINVNDGRIQNAVFRNGCMWYAQTGALPKPTPNRTVALWHQVTTDLTVVQQGMIDDGNGPTPMFYFFPSLAVTADNDIGLGFSGSAATSFASAYYTNHKHSSLPGTMEPIALLKAGEGTYVKTFGAGENRWGDFSQTCIDPVDGLVWTIQEYAATPVGSGDGSGRWGTWWGKFDAAGVLPLSAPLFPEP